MPDTTVGAPNTVNPTQPLLWMQGYAAQVSDIEVMAQLMAKNQTVLSILSSRQATLQVVSGFWARGDTRGALTALLQSSGVISAHTA